MDVEVLVDVQKTYIFLECLVISTIPLSPGTIRAITPFFKAREVLLT